MPAAHLSAQSPGLLIRLTPTGPWRIGPDSGARDRVDRIYHSDSLYSAVTWAMLRLGKLEEWLDATARRASSNGASSNGSPAGPAVRLSSCFPRQGKTLYVTPPRSLWPPPATSKVRWKGARFVPLGVVESLARGEALAPDRWMIDTPSECLVPFRSPSTPGPFQVTVRSSAAVDRGGNGVAPHATACLEFTPGAGLWTVAQFADDAAASEWTAPLTGAFRLLADSGFGGERSRGWGRSEMPHITRGQLPDLLMRPAPTPEQPDAAAARAPHADQKADEKQAWWLLSLFHPAPSDPVDWAQGDYLLTTRGGRIDSDAASGGAKNLTRMIAEGSVLFAPELPQGSAPDVAPAGFAHPVYRYGFAVALPIPVTAPKEFVIPEPEPEPEPLPEAGSAPSGQSEDAVASPQAPTAEQTSSELAAPVSFEFDADEEELSNLEAAMNALEEVQGKIENRIEDKTEDNNGGPAGDPSDEVTGQ